MTNTYDCGDVIRLSAVFTDISNDPADPSAVTLRVKQPDATVVIHTFPGGVTKDSTGAYHFDLAITESGDWYYRFEGTGTVQAASETLFHVHRSNVV